MELGFRDVRYEMCYGETTPATSFSIHEAGISSMNAPFSPRSTQAAEGLPRRRFTVAEIEAIVAAGVIDEDERFELIGGEVVPMSPKGIRHELVKAALIRLWASASNNAILAPETTFHLSDDTFLEPDILIYSRDIVLAGVSGPNVLLVVEVSDSSLSYDLGRKADLYASFGVRELWVIDAASLEARTFATPSTEGYRECVDVPPHETLKPMFAPDVFSLKLEDIELI